MSTNYRSTLDRTAISYPKGMSYEITSKGSVTLSERVTLSPVATERDYVSHLWAQDWDSAEDSAYDRY